VPWDRERYRREVLDPARRSGPPADLFVRYAFTARPPAGKAFGDQVGEVVAEWNKYKSKPGWGKLIESLITQHEALERAGKLTSEAFQARRREELQAAVRKLDALVSAENATHVGPAVIARLREAAGAGVSDEQVRGALAKAGITVVDRLPALPVTPPPNYARLVPELRAVGLWLSAEVIFGPAAVRAGFRVLAGFQLADGQRIHKGTLADASRRTAVMPHDDPAKTPTETVLVVVRSAAEDGTLDELLLWEVMAPLRQRLAGFNQKQLAGEAAATGLDKNEAGILAAAMLTEGTAAGSRRRISEDLAAGRLRSAQLNAASLDADDELRVRVDAAVAEVTRLVTGADTEERAGRTEAAARLLSEALALVSDDPGLAERLAGLAPPPPRSVDAVVDGDRVLVSWQASAAQGGRVRYRVRRGTGRPPGSPAEGVEIAAETTELHAVDENIPPGADLHYAVFAGRGGPGWSRPARAAPVLFTPDVSEVNLNVAADAVGAAWRVPRGAAQVMVTRTAGRDQARITSDLTGFTDADLTPGTEYTYRISVVYRGTDGSARPSPGVTVQATPTPAPQPVADLQVQARPPVIELSWAPPPLGRVELRISKQAPPWDPGAELDQAELAAFGRPVPGNPRPAAPGLVSVQLTPPPGRHFVVAVTRVGGRAVAGARTQLGLAAPVDGLRAERLLDQAQLSWIWPADAVDSIIAWPGAERRCSRRVYDDEGGALIPIGPGEVVVTVSAVHPDTTAELVSPAVTVTIPARQAKVSYRWLKAGLLQPGRRLLELTTDRPCELPELVVVRSTAAFPPDEPADGIELARLPPISIVPGAPLKIPVELPRRATGYLACFVAASRDAGPLLFPPPPSEMRIR
jgi:hypothetical protein